MCDALVELANVFYNVIAKTVGATNYSGRRIRGLTLIGVQTMSSKLRIELQIVSLPSSFLVDRKAHVQLYNDMYIN